MASLYRESGVLLNFADVAPSPSRDYCQIYVTTKQVIFRVWKITRRSDAKVSPIEMKVSHEDFLYDDRCQSEIHRCFGKHMVEYVKLLVTGHIDYLPRLPEPLLVHILHYLPLEDISRVACVSKDFKQLCQSDALWERLYKDQTPGAVTDDLQTLGDAVGWKALYFTNKLKLQVQLHRVAAMKEMQKHMADLPGAEGLDPTIFLTGVNEEED